jgi:signal transduction histidine kinase
VTHTIAARLTAAVLVAFTLLLVISALALYAFSALDRGASLIKDHHLPEAALFEDIRVLLTDAAAQTHAHALSGGAAHHERAFRADVASIDRAFRAHAALHATVPITPPEVAGIASLRQATDRLVRQHDAVVRLIGEGSLDEARRVSETEGRTATATALAVAVGMVDVERRESEEQMAGARAIATRAYHLILATALLSALVSGAVGLSVIRSVTVPVRRLVETTRRVNRGDLSIRSGLVRRDEIGELAQSFDRMIARLDATFSGQQRFLADVSHELRTPITIVRGHLEVLKRGARTPEQLERAVTISVEELDRMARLVNDLLLLVRATRTDFLAPEPIDLPDFLDHVLEKGEAIAPRGWRRGHVVETTLVGDRDRLTQALLNLLRNAAEHTTPQATIEVSADVRDGFVEIAVADQGEGIPPELLPRVFDRFRRRGSPDAPPGWGLGLSIVQAIARAHGGEVRAESRLGAGSVFTIALPHWRRDRRDQG